MCENTQLVNFSLTINLYLCRMWRMCACVRVCGILIMPTIQRQTAQCMTLTSSICSHPPPRVRGPPEKVRFNRTYTQTRCFSQIKLQEHQQIRTKTSGGRKECGTKQCQLRLTQTLLSQPKSEKPFRLPSPPPPTRPVAPTQQRTSASAKMRRH